MLVQNDYDASLLKEKPDALAQLWHKFAQQKILLEEKIKAQYGHHIPIIPQISDHLFGAGGKRLRPLLCFASASLSRARFNQDHSFAGQDDKVIGLAAAIEYLHSASLLHDDVVDGSALRRGNKTAHTLWGNSAAILVGDYLFANAFQMITDCDSLNIMNILARTTKKLAEGQLLELTGAYNLDQTIEDYMAMITAKTAFLFAASAEMGAAIHCGAESYDEHDPFIRGLADYGKGLGIAFQLIDDVIDYDSSDAAMGKAQGDDFFEGKITLPILLLYQKLDERQRAWLQAIFDPAQPRTQAQFTEICQFLTDFKVIEQAGSMANQAIKDAQAALDHAMKALGLQKEPDAEAKHIANLLMALAPQTLARIS